jgi:parallel beta-helix repeat protein
MKHDPSDRTKLIQYRLQGLQVGTALTLILIVAAACARAAATPTDPKSPGPTHALALNTGNDDSAITAWVAAINADCADKVRATVPKGTATMRTLPFFTIATACANTNRHLDISGYSADSSTIMIASKAPDGSGGIGFFVEDPHVHMHDLGFRSLADTMNVPTFRGGAGNSDEAIKFTTALNGSGGFGEADHMRFVNFRTASIDVYGAPGMNLHDNVVICAPMLAPNYDPAMGLWVRVLLKAPATGASNGMITNNQVANCGDSGIDLDNASYITVTNNTVTCTDPDCQQGIFATPKRNVLGIVLYADHTGCSTEGTSHNLIQGNTIHARNRITHAIILEGSGIGNGNVFMDNAIDSAAVDGIAVSNYACPGPVPAFRYDTMTHNTIAGALTAGIMNGGSDDVITYNQICPAAGAVAILDISGNAVLQQNVSVCTAGQSVSSYAPPH